MKGSISLLLAALAGFAAASDNIPRMAWNKGEKWVKPTGQSTTTETDTTYTTTTVCPTTYTKGGPTGVVTVTSEVTSTITVTCKSGKCHHDGDQPTLPPPPPPSTPTGTCPPGYVTSTTIYPTTITTKYPVWTPCSTPIASTAGTTYYSTWATFSYVTTTYTSLCTGYTYVPPQGGKPTAAPPAPPAPPAPQPENPKPDNCPPAQTYYVTVTETVNYGGMPAPSPKPENPPALCHDCYVEVTTVVTKGQTQTLTYTKTHGGKPSQPTPGNGGNGGGNPPNGGNGGGNPPNGGNGGNPPNGTGNGGPKPTGGYHYKYARKADPKKMW